MGFKTGLGMGVCSCRFAHGASIGATSQINLSPSSVSLSPDTTTATVTGIARDASGNMTGAVVTYHSSSPSVATINSSTGVITRVAAGTTNITATSGAITSNTVVLTSAAFGATTQILLSPSTLSVSTTGAVTAVAKDQFGNATGAVVTYHSSAPNRATVNSSTGVVTYVTDGTTSITATFGAITSNACTVTAAASTGVPAAIAILPSSVTLASVGSTQQFTATATDINGATVAGTVFEWYSTDTRYVTIDTDSGLATRVQAGGSPKIYARYELLPAWTVRASAGPTEFAAGNTGVFSSGGTIVDGAETSGAFPAGTKLVRLDYDRLDTEGEKFQEDAFDGSGNQIVFGTTPFSPRQWYNVDRNRGVGTDRNVIVVGVDEELLMEWTFAVDNDTIYFDARGTLGTKWDYPRTGDGDTPANVPTTFCFVQGINNQVAFLSQYDMGVGGIVAIEPGIAGNYVPPLVTATKFTHLHRFDSDWGQGNGRMQLLVNDVSQLWFRAVRYSDPSAEYTSPGDIMARVFNILTFGDQVSGQAPYHRRVWLHDVKISTRRYR